MDFDRIYLKGVRDKFGFEENDHDFSDSEGFIDYSATQNVPSTLEEKGGIENLSSITVVIMDVDVEVEYDRGTMVPYGDTWVEYESSGYYVEDVDCSTDVKFKFDGDDITREQYMKFNNISEDEMEAIERILKEEALDKYKEWIEENYEYEPPEPPEPDYDDYY